MGTIPSVQLFRNSIIKTGRQAAINALEAQKASVPDGGLILARYSDDGGENNVKTLLGIVRNGGGTEAQLTIIDVEGAAENLQNAIKKISGATASQEGKFISAITQTNGVVSVEFGGVAAANVSVASDKFTATTVENVLLEIQDSLDAAIGTGGSVAEQITNAINDLDSSATSENNYFDVTVAQKDGKITGITVTNKDIASATLLGKKEDASTAETAFGRIAKEAADREAAIKTLNFGPVGGNGQVITTISQTDGKVSATAATLGAENVAFTSSDTAFTSNNVSAALDALYAQSGDGSKVVIDSGTTTEGYSKTYTFTQGGIEIGKIDIPKDLVVKSGSVVKGNWNDGVFTENVSGSGTALKLVIANKEETPIYINTLDLVKDHTGGNGIAISDTNVISVQVADGSEEFLSVGKSGVKLSGVQAAIDAAAASAKTKVEKTDGGSHVTLTSTTSTTDSSVTYTISESDIASANALTAETNARESADTALSNRLGDGVTTAEGKTVTAQLQALSGTTSDGSDATSVIGAKKYTDAKIEELSLTPVGGTSKVITAISQENGLVSASAIDLTASNVKATESTGVSTAVDVTGETVSEQIASLATSIKSASTAAAAAHTEVKPKTDEHVRVSVSKSSDNTHDVVTITEDDIASATALEDETTNRQNADTELSNKLGTGITTVATVTEQLKALSGTTGDASGVTSVEGAKAYAKDLVDNLNAEVGSTTGTSKTEAIKIVQDMGKIKSITLGAFDCGTYN